MPRYKAIVAYDGTDFFGFQLQTKNGVESARTVQGELNKVVNQMAKSLNHPLKWLAHHEQTRAYTHLDKSCILIFLMILHRITFARG